MCEENQEKNDVIMKWIILLILFCIPVSLIVTKGVASIVWFILWFLKK